MCAAFVELPPREMTKTVCAARNRAQDGDYSPLSLLLPRRSTRKAARLANSSGMFPEGLRAVEYAWVYAQARGNTNFTNENGATCYAPHTGTKHGDITTTLGIWF